MTGCSCQLAEAPGTRRVAQVLLDSALPQLDHLFDYGIPEELVDTIKVGQRIRVPFRSSSRNTFGWVIGFAAASEFKGQLSPITDLVGDVPLLTPEVWHLARAVADRAGGSAGDILRLAIPGRQVRVEKKHIAAGIAATEVHAAIGGDGALGDGGAEIAAGATAPAELPLDGDAAPAAGERSTEARIATQLCSGARLAMTVSHGPERLETGEWVGGWALQLAKLAVEVYAQDKSVILVAPDYRDQDQLLDALAAIGHDETVRVDSRQSNGERYASFLRALDKTPRIIAGNRSAVYAPAHNLGAVIFWDDGDSLLSEPLAPYVHARDAALVRAGQSGAGLFFASHARSTDVQRLIEIGYVDAQVNPPRRTRVVHADSALAPDAFAGRVPEFVAREIRKALRTGPVLVQVATAGYAPVAVCADCNDLARCGACAGPIGFRAAGRAACRWCGEPPVKWQCPTCDGRQLQERGMGSGRTVEQFEQQFKGFRVLLSDGEHPRESVDARPALVVATRGAEPLAAGGYRAVVLLDAERLLGLPHLRAGEDCLRWWENAAALANPDGVCIMASGGGDVVQAFVSGRTDEWLRHELRDRQQLRYPPAVRVVSVSGGRAEIDRALDTLEKNPAVTGYDVLGPTALPPEPGSPQLSRAIVRFDYNRGGEIAKRLRGALVADAAGGSSKARGKSAPGRARPEALRLRFDDRGVFDG
ncbi:hypothetical protein ICM05_11900 [Leucobacter sp. cx-42]|uniref:primosomal protein N' family DNA-binding protein n=1 Tax=unclassified Leucobacter TaxID=2621730 RepID=UPI00165D68BE|nr:MULTISPECIES: hypothetical protein [unclassified Leucobacter]MBC9955325.1 hypothetical protein [Leucobacter sp. cx-42]